MIFLFLINMISYWSIGFMDSLHKQIFRWGIAFLYYEPKIRVFYRVFHRSMRLNSVFYNNCQLKQQAYLTLCITGFQWGNKWYRISMQ